MPCAFIFEVGRVIKTTYTTSSSLNHLSGPQLLHLSHEVWHENDEDGHDDDDDDDDDDDEEDVNKDKENI